jgi:hypothetical protein
LNGAQPTHRARWRSSQEVVTLMALGTYREVLTARRNGAISD